MGWTTGVRFPTGRGKGFSLFATAADLEFIQRPIQWVVKVFPGG
jgi:hypothetical protein